MRSDLGCACQFREEMLAAVPDPASFREPPPAAPYQSGEMSVSRRKEPVRLSSSGGDTV